MDINDDIMSMPKGWIVHYENGTIITEYDQNGTQRGWREVPKVGIKMLSLKWHNKHWSIHGKEAYLQKKRAWVIPVANMEQEPNIEFRYIGYWEGNNKVFYKVSEATGQMQMVVESIETQR